MEMHPSTIGMHPITMEIVAIVTVGIAITYMN